MSTIEWSIMQSISHEIRSIYSGAVSGELREMELNRKKVTRTQNGDTKKNPLNIYYKVK